MDLLADRFQESEASSQLFTLTQGPGFTIGNNKVLPYSLSFGHCIACTICCQFCAANCCARDATGQPEPHYVFVTAENIATRYDSFGLQTPSVILGRRKGHVFGTWKGPEVRGPTVRRQHSLEDPRFWLGSVVAGILGPRRAPELRKGSVDRFKSENLRYSPSGGSTSANARRYLLRSVRIGSCSDAHDA